MKMESCRQNLLRGLNFIVTAFIFTPLVVVYWYGVWNLLELLQKSIHWNLHAEVAAIAWIISTLLMWLFSLLDMAVHNVSYKSHETCVDQWTAFKRLYYILVSFVCILQWWSVWDLLDDFLPSETTLRVEKSVWYATYIVLAGAVVFLLAIRGLRNTVRLPLFLVRDSSTSVLRLSTRFNTDKAVSPDHIMDQLLSAALIQTAVSTAWWSMWRIADEHFLPSDNHLDTLIASVAIGYSSCILVYLFQYAYKPVSKQLSDRKLAVCRVLLEDIFMFVGFFGSVNVWRGCWLTTDYIWYINLHSGQLSWGVFLSLCICLSLCVLLACQVFASTISRGCQVDGDHCDEKGDILSLQVLNCFISSEVEKDERYGRMGSNASSLEVFIMSGNQESISDSASQQSGSTDDGTTRDKY